MAQVTNLHEFFQIGFIGGGPHGGGFACYGPHPSGHGIRSYHFVGMRDSHELVLLKHIMDSKDVPSIYRPNAYILWSNDTDDCHFPFLEIVDNTTHLACLPVREIEALLCQEGRHEEGKRAVTPKDLEKIKHKRVVISLIPAGSDLEYFTQKGANVSYIITPFDQWCSENTHLRRKPSEIMHVAV